jgi:methyl halide transferase
MLETTNSAADIACCVVECERPLDQAYWDAQYKNKTTGWDLGTVAPPIKAYFDTITRKTARILIPGCGNTHEAEYLLAKGFSNITVIDIAPTLVESLKQKFVNNPNITVVLGDFFEHQGSYDFIVEQTFFCALPPTLRQKYVYKMHQLLKPNGRLVGLLFDRTFDVSPPFGGSRAEYETLFKAAFNFFKIENCENSFQSRANTELWLELQKNNTVIVNIYAFEGITCSGCMQTITKQFSAIEGVLNVSINTAFNEVLIVSNWTIASDILENAIAYDKKYKIILNNLRK